MNLHHGEIANQVAPRAIAALLLDKEGWHMSRKLGTGRWKKVQAKRFQKSFKSK